MSEDIPESISCSTVNIFGVELVVHVLSDGRRVIEAESMARFLAAMADPSAPSASDDQLAELARVLRT